MGLALTQQPGLRGDRMSGVNVPATGRGASGSQWSEAGTNGLRVAGWGSSRLVRRVEAGPASSPHPGGEEARASGWSRLQGDGGAEGSGGRARLGAASIKGSLGLPPGGLQRARQLGALGAAAGVSVGMRGWGESPSCPQELTAMEMKAEGLQAGGTGGGGGVHSLHGTHFCTSVEFTANTGSAAHASLLLTIPLREAAPLSMGGRLRHRGVGELAQGPASRS